MFKINSVKQTTKTFFRLFPDNKNVKNNQTEHALQHITHRLIFGRLNVIPIQI